MERLCQDRALEAYRLVMKSLTSISIKGHKIINKPYLLDHTFDHHIKGTRIKFFVLIDLILTSGVSMFNHTVDLLQILLSTQVQKNPKCFILLQFVMPI